MLLHHRRTGLAFRTGQRFPQPVPLGPQLLVDKRHHLGRILRMGSLRHHLRRHHPVLARNVVIEVPYPAVVERSGKVVYDLPVVHRLGCGRGHVFEEEVRLFEHIPEIKIVMRKIELIQIVLLHDRRTEYVHRGEHPAAARLLLVGNPLHIHPVFEIMVHLTVEPVVQRQGPYIAVGGQYVLYGHDGRVAAETVAHPRHVIAGYGLCIGRNTSRNHERSRQQDTFLHV